MEWIEILQISLSNSEPQGLHKTQGMKGDWCTPSPSIQPVISIPSRLWRDLQLTDLQFLDGGTQVPPLALLTA